ncbi:hypothetical protein HY36_05325 [Hyphomonas atlantica]|uniref:Uncharacterized protein n=1 Tax=Hyphomonas atlantica TaxID=1280948 RepID=A0A059E0D9_9PROT|nr:hypothetical protein HY36_05325 [Hyphomonas atlantica]|tara:strand:- start:1820 stop:2107 length:288 start_codon:yes stop_codon:yes gene_type:complete
MSVPFVMEGAVEVQDRRVDPGALPALGAFSAHFHNACKSLVDCDFERLLLYRSEQPLWDVELIQGNDPTHVRINKEQIRIVTCIAHWENSPAIAG